MDSEVRVYISIIEVTTSIGVTEVATEVANVDRSTAEMDRSEIVDKVR